MSLCVSLSSKVKWTIVLIVFIKKAEIDKGDKQISLPDALTLHLQLLCTFYMFN